MTPGLNKTCPSAPPSTTEAVRGTSSLALLPGAIERMHPLRPHPKAVYHLWDAPTCSEHYSVSKRYALVPQNVHTCRAAL